MENRGLLQAVLGDDLQKTRKTQGVERAMCMRDEACKYMAKQIIKTSYITNTYIGNGITPSLRTRGPY